MAIGYALEMELAENLVHDFHFSHMLKKRSGLNYAKMARIPPSSSTYREVLCERGGLEVVEG